VSSTLWKILFIIYKTDWSCFNFQIFINAKSSLLCLDTVDIGQQDRQHAMETMHVTPLKRTLFLLPNLNALVAANTGVWAVKLCFNKILLTGGSC